MTEAEWLNCTDPDQMTREMPQPASDRQLRLFACACCRQFWDHLLKGTEALLVAERFADGLASEEELVDACPPPSYQAESADYGYLWRALERLVDADAINSTGAAVELAEWAARREQGRIRSQNPGKFGPELMKAFGEIAAKAVRRGQCVLLHDIVGNPFRPVTIDAAWRTVKVVELAQAIYDREDRTSFSELAAALEEAGCGNADILDHWRRGGDHVRGCWVVDLILGKS